MSALEEKHDISEVPLEWGVKKPKLPGIMR